MQKDIADTIALMSSKEILVNKLPTMPESAAHESLAIDFVEFAKKLSLELQNNYSDVNLALFQGNHSAS
ncbi:hypothetical protein HMPREF0027_1120 [Actinobacillus ureae ATCC 25976]|uniref:Uncharacterized protein n=1 Tax=Actinobacillus ureae ATCC 25976 TaxID=887324 RepID=E8KH03_9PAST|nr:hypothetical protein [Actinobacillus ureae]EFX91829.1 hypothetical protein HMPREF0027_1120 [Actinobacillus ureae ATCC 25976]